ncbi:hypothetical protein VQ03_12030 [Methylobacterium tarhaniae]|uniref:Uncharacterized protein n=1 Tax=Methylobacterium tarhaniae TaxID=1187852 RepID=A0A0J6T744_9HYPH|nr:hypothetical protein [Methylobacterium tarhaniae]KMO41702.1 hypothetical protein VQ03_12030 [Methylobacterium tarhaniae]
MPAYRLRGAVRATDGTIGPPLIDETITAEGRQEAVRRANAREATPADEQVNALWLVDEGGNLVWSLRLADREG